MNLVVVTVFFNDGRKTTSFDVNDDNKIIIIIHILWKSHLYINETVLCLSAIKHLFCNGWFH